MGTGYYLCLPLEVFYSRDLHEYRIWQFQVQWEQKDDHPDITATNELAYLEIFLFFNKQWNKEKNSKSV